MVTTHEVYHESISSFKTSVNDIKQQIGHVKRENLNYRWQIDKLDSGLENSTQENVKLRYDLNKSENDYHELETIQKGTEAGLKKVTVRLFCQQITSTSSSAFLPLYIFASSSSIRKFV